MDKAVIKKTIGKTRINVMFRDVGETIVAVGTK